MAAIRRLSLRWKIPGLIAVVLVAGVTTFAVATYRSLKQSTVEAEHVRLGSAASRVSQLVQTSIATNIRPLRAVATDTSVVALLRGENPSPQAVRAAVARLGPDTGSIIAVEIRDSKDRTVFALGNRTPVSERLLEVAANDSSTVSAFSTSGDTVFFDYTASITAQGRTLGRVVQTRRVVPTGQALRVLTDLIGGNAALLVGHADGSFWMENGKPTRRPPPSLSGSEYLREGQRRLATSAQVPGSPWVIAAELPEDAVLGPIRVLAQRVILLGFVIIVAGIWIGHRMSRGITGRLARLTAASETIAAGDLSHQRDGTEGNDELGRLSHSFSVMADNLRGARENLEQQISARTAELESALTQLREAQEDALRKERLTTLGHLASGVGHELRNPLGVMSNAVYVLEAKLTDAPPKVKEYLDILRAQVRLSEKIVSDLLDTVRNKPPQRARVSVEDLVTEQRNRIFMPSSIRIEQNIAPTVPPVYVDRVQIGQVLHNVFMNAVHAMEATGGGTLSLRAQPQNGVVRLEIRDSGPGIPLENQARVFEPLFTTKARGIGLGLSLSRALARANEGDLTVRSEPGAGATFVLEMPAAKAE